MKMILKLFAIFSLCFHATLSRADWKAALREGLWGAVRVMVVDDSMTPVEGVMVSLCWGTIGGNERKVSGVTNNEGVIQFKGKSSGLCQVSASKSGYFDSWSEFSFLPPRNTDFKEALEKSSQLGHWEDQPKQITLTLQRRFTPFILPERHLRIDFSSVCPTNLTRNLDGSTNAVSNHVGELAFSLREVDEGHSGKPPTFILSASCNDGQEVFIVRDRKTQSDYRFDTVAPEGGYTNTLAIAEIDSGARHLRPLVDFYEKYVVFRQKTDAGFLFAVIEFCDAYALRGEGFRIKLTYVLFPQKQDNNIQFEKTNQWSSTCASLPEGME